MSIVWRGTTEESLALLAAVESNCVCVFDFEAKGARVSVCDAHALLVQGQRVLNGLVFARRIADRLVRQEWLREDPGGMGLEAKR
jgi:hypothetical protein